MTLGPVPHPETAETDRPGDDRQLAAGADPIKLKALNYAAIGAFRFDILAVWMDKSQQNEAKGPFMVKKPFFLPTIQIEEIFNKILKTV